MQCNQKDMPPDLQIKKLKLKRCDMPVRTRGQLTQLCGKIKERITWRPTWTNHQQRKVLWWKEKCLKAPTEECYKQNVQYVNQWNQMANIYLMSQHGTQYFFPLAETYSTNQPDVLSSCVGHYSRWDVRFLFVRKFDKKCGRIAQFSSSRGR